MKYTGLLLKENSPNSYTVLYEDHVVGMLTHYQSTLESTYKDKVVYSERVDAFKSEEEKDRYYSLATWEIKKEIIREKITLINYDNDDDCNLSHKSIKRSDLYIILNNLCEQLEISHPHDSEFRIYICDWLTSKGFTIVYS
jgi:hypothetical protein